MAEFLGITKRDIPDDVFPLHYALFDSEQQKDKTLLAHLRKYSPGYALTTFRGGGKTRKLITYNGKIAVP